MSGMNRCALPKLQHKAMADTALFSLFKLIWTLFLFIQCPFSENGHGFRAVSSLKDWLHCQESNSTPPPFLETDTALLIKNCWQTAVN